MATFLERANEKLRERAKAIEDARKVMEREDPGAEDQAEHAKLLDRAEELQTAADAFKRQYDADANLNDLPPSQDRTNPPKDPEKAEPWKLEVRGGRPGAEYVRDYMAMPGTAKYERTRPEYNEVFRQWLAATTKPEEIRMLMALEKVGEKTRALEATDDTQGGYTQPPEQFKAQLIKFIDDAVFIRGLATVHSVPQAESLGAPSLDADPADSDWTTELATGSEDSTMAFGKRELRPSPLAKSIKISKKLIRASALNIPALVAQRLAYKFAVTEEKAFLTGTGANQPLGVFTADADGITTGRDVSTGNTNTTIEFDGLIEAKYTLKAGYWAAARWLFHRDAIKQISKLKDGEGQYQWQPSTQAGQADRLLGFPFLVSEFAPSTFTTGLYVGMLADFSHYWIADALSMTIQTLVELHALTNQNGIIGRLETDGQPVLEEAFVRVTLT